MRVTQQWAVLAAVLLAVCSVQAEEPSWSTDSWSVKESMLARRSADAEAAKQEDVQGRNYAVHEQIYSNETEVNELVEQLITSRREGRILNDYDQVYADGNVDQALMQGDDMQARNLVRDKLCSLGLMSCETEGKRQYYSTIYAQGPPPPNKFGGGPYGPAKPMPPPGFYNGRPPMGPPPSSVNSFGPPRKVGYESSYKPGYRPSGPGGNYNGPYLESPPPSAIDGSGLTTFNKPPPGAIIYGSKPPGPVYSGNGASNKIPPYAFENPEKIHAAGSQQTNFYSHQSSASASQSSSTKVVVGGTVANAVSASAAGLQQHVHHHFHHVDGGDSAKVPTVPVPLGNGQTINTDFSALAQSSTAFNPQTSASFGGQSQNSYNAGFNAASQGGLLSQTSNGFKPNGLGSFGAGSSAGGAGSNGYGSTGFGSSGSNFNAGSNFASGTTGFGSSNAGYASGSSNAGYGSGSSSSSSYHSQNPSYYKKELQNFGGIQASSSNNFNSLTSGYDQSSYNNGAGYDTSRNQYVDCQCVPFNQCPAADRIGRKEDLILAIDPRNLGKDIEALSDEAAANITTNAMPEKKEDSATEDKKHEEEGEKKRSKREAEAAKDKQDEAADLPLDAEGRIFDNQGAIAAIQLVQRKILPTYGVSFGLPYPNNPAGYPSNVLGDHYPAQNPFFGAIGPNGLNLGLIHVNPLVSVQVQKTEFGEKVVKPLVNLHVTPNLNIFSKIGSLLKPKGTLIENHHYHHHEHYTGFEHDHHHHHPEIITGPGPIYSEHKPEIITGPGIVHPYATDFKHYEVETYPSKPIFEYHSGPQIVSPEVHPIPSPIHDHPPHHHHHGHYPELFGQHHQEHFENHDHDQQHFVDNPPQQVEEHPPQHVEEQYPPHVEEHPAQHVVEHHQQHVEQHFQHHVEQHSSHNSYQSFSSSFPASGTGNGNHATGPSYPPSGTGSGGDGSGNYPTGSFYPPSGNSGFGASNSYPPDQGYNTGYGGSAAGGSEIIYDRNSNGNQSLTFGQSQRNRKGKGLQIHNIPTQAPGTAEGSSYVTFPKDRRRRSVQDQTLERKSSVMTDTAKLQERAYYGNRPVEKTCRVNEVCCRRPLRPVPPPQQFGRCGVRNAAGITGRIKNPVYVDGDSEFGEYPWHVAILKKDPKESIYACGATLIDAQHVITAAHCIKAQNGFDLRARLGEWDVNHDVEFFPYIERDVVSVQIHPEYYAGTLDNDLAVLKLDSPVDFSKNPHISPACLPDKYSDFTSARCWTTGWGKDAFGEHGKYQNILKEVDVPILSHHQCESQLRQTRLGYSYKLNPGFLCAGGEEGKDACKGDGGGPLVCERQGIWQVAGVVSWGIGCGQANVPGVYVKVSHYLDWIRQITQYYK